MVMSEKTAQALGVTDEDRVAIDYNGQTVWGSVWRVPGQPDGCHRADPWLRPDALGPGGQWRGIRCLSAAPGRIHIIATGATVRKLEREVPAGGRAASLHDGRPRSGRTRVRSTSSSRIPISLEKQSETAAQWPDHFPADVQSTKATRGAWRSI